MQTEDRSQRNLAAGLTRMVGQLLSDFTPSSRVTTDTLLATAIASFFPQLRQFGGRTLQLIIDGHVTEIVLPSESATGVKLRENDNTIVLTKDERAIVLSLAATIAMDPEGFEKFSFKDLAD